MKHCNLLYKIRNCCTTETCFVTNISPKRLCKFSGFQTSYNDDHPVNAVYCENHMEHTDTLCGQNAEFF
jgi:hypothetical protein